MIALTDTPIMFEQAAPAEPQPGTLSRGIGKKLVRIALVMVGLVLVLLGIVIAPLPGPMGLPVMIVGLVIVLRNSFWARRQFVRAQRRYPRYLTPLRRLLRRNANAGPIFWQLMLRAERVFPLHWRALRRLRRMSRAKKNRI